MKKNETGYIPPLSCLYINPTQYCNLACKHCWLSPPCKEGLDGAEGELSMEQIINVIDEAVGLGLTSIKLTGGEPLLRKDIGELMEFCFNSKIGVDIETNGTLVTEKTAGMFRRFDVGHISVSIDSAEAAVHDHLRGKKGAFQDAMNGIENLKSEGFSPQVIMSLYRKNLDSFEDFFKFMRDVGIFNIKINVISCIGRGEKILKEDLAPTVEEVLEFAEKLKIFTKGFSGRVYLDTPIAFKEIEEIKYRGCSACNMKNILGLLPNGDISICGIGIVDENLLFGNVKDKKNILTDIWHNHPVVNEIRQDLPSKIKGVCAKCVFKNICLGSCRAEVYHNTADLLAPSWFCQEAYEKGLFPGTRIIPEEILT